MAEINAAQVMAKLAERVRHLEAMGQSVSDSLLTSAYGRIILVHLDGTVGVYMCSQEGVDDAIAAAGAGDAFLFPRDVQISLTAPITIPASTNIYGANLKFSGFDSNWYYSGGLNIRDGCIVKDCIIEYDGTGYTQATGITNIGSANSWDAHVLDTYVYVHGATDYAVGICVIGNTNFMSEGQPSIEACDVAVFDAQSSIGVWRQGHSRIRDCHIEVLNVPPLTGLITSPGGSGIMSTGSYSNSSYPYVQGCFVRVQSIFGLSAELYSFRATSATTVVIVNCSFSEYDQGGVTANEHAIYVEASGGGSGEVRLGHVTWNGDVVLPPGYTLVYLDGDRITSPHHATHENGGSDEIDVTGLSGTLADPQPAAAHHDSHESGGSDMLENVDLADGYVILHHGAGANSRSWKIVRDVTSDGYFAIQSQTAKDGGFNLNRLVIDSSGNIIASTPGIGYYIGALGGSYRAIANIGDTWGVAGGGGGLLGTRNTSIGDSAGANLGRGSAYNLILGSYAGNIGTTINGSVLIGTSAGENADNINGMVCIGNNAGSGGGNPCSPSYSIYIGDGAGISPGSSEHNIGIGSSALQYTEGNYNVAIGAAALRNNTSGEYNVAVGTEAGWSVLGSANVLLGYSAGWQETGSNKLYIENSDSATPLIYGEFDNNLVKIYGTLTARGMADAVQLTVQGYSTQTAHLTDWKANGGGVLAYVNGGGDGYFNALCVPNGVAYSSLNNVGVWSPIFLMDGSNNINFQCATGVIYFYNGSASYQLSLYSATDLNVLINSNGDSYFNGGDVGIGNASPGVKLDVAGTIRSYNAGNHSKISQVTAGGVTWAWDTFNTNDLKLTTDAGGGLTPLTILSNGNIGVGVVAPLAKFHVNVTTNENLWVYDNSGWVGLSAINDAGDTYKPMSFIASEFLFSVGNVGIGTAPNASAKLHVRSGADENLWLRDHDGYIELFAANDAVDANTPLSFFASKFYFQAGFVGIGNTNPQAQLDVTGDIYLSGNTSVIDVQPTANYDTSQATYFRLTPEYGSHGYKTPVASIDLVRTSTSEDTYDGVISMQTRATGGGLTERVRISKEGYVGIGVQPAAKLHIVGNTDVPQLEVMGNATQTNPIVKIRDGSYNNVVTIDKRGKLTIAPIVYPGEVNYGLQISSTVLDAFDWPESLVDYTFSTSSTANITTNAMHRIQWYSYWLSSVDLASHNLNAGNIQGRLYLNGNSVNNGYIAFYGQSQEVYALENGSETIYRICGYFSAGVAYRHGSNTSTIAEYIGYMAEQPSDDIVGHAYGVLVNDLHAETQSVAIYVSAQTGSPDTYAIYTAAGKVNLGDTTLISGSRDGVQLTVKGYSTQTNNIVVVSDSTDDIRFAVGGSASGYTTFAGNATDGDYIAFAGDGEVSLHGTARVTREFIIPLTGFNHSGTKPTETILGNYIGYAFGINDLAYASFETPSDWDASADINILIHWYINEAYAANSGEVKWAVIYTATKEDGSEAVDGATATVDSGDVNIPATAKYLVETSVSIPHAALEQHDMIGFQVKRVALTGGNNPTAEPVIVALECEYVANRLGIAT